MILQREAYIEALQAAKLDKTGHDRAIEMINSSDIKAHGRNIPFSYIPLFIDDDDLIFFNNVIKTIQSILSKMTRHYIKDPKYREVFGFDKKMEELICLPCNYDEIIPVGRYDIFYDESDRSYKFCEFNTDGSGGMSRDYEMSCAILKSFANREVVDRFNMRPFDLIGFMAESIINVYRSDKNAIDNPTFCITDFREEGVMSDFDRFIEEFRKRGINARFTDIRDLKFEGNHLVDSTDGTIINGIYRRAVTSVVLDRIEECGDFIEAVRRQKVVLIGHFRTSLAHSKVVSSAMFNPMTAEILTESENDFIREHMPRTYIMSKGLIPQEVLNDVLDNKNDWIIKPEEGFGSHGVYAGRDTDRDEWIRLIEDNMDSNYTVQEFIERSRVPLLGPNDDVIKFYPLMMGIYQACGEAAGFYSRAGEAGVIDFDHGGICVSTVRCGSIK